MLSRHMKWAGLWIGQRANRPYQRLCTACDAHCLHSSRLISILLLYRTIIAITISLLVLSSSSFRVFLPAVTWDVQLSSWTLYISCPLCSWEKSSSRRFRRYENWVARYKAKYTYTRLSTKEVTKWSSILTDLTCVPNLPFAVPLTEKSSIDTAFPYLLHRVLPWTDRPFC